MQVIERAAAFAYSFVSNNYAQVAALRYLFGTRDRTSIMHSLHIVAGGRAPQGRMPGEIGLVIGGDGRNAGPVRGA